MISSMQMMARLSKDWAVRCFGSAHVLDGAVRGLRHAEEAVEICQSLGVKKDDVIKMIEIVYSKDPDPLFCEVGGSILTLAVLCESHNIDLEYAFMQELSRVLNKDPVYFAERNAVKVNPNNG